ncbi:MAG: hypothetical protein A2487_14105 [Candidatus Raymondbacteria bacterium RifOxyC12_full_50_8]|nr:MAG: hypothetical protein A2350_15500 [Candidatus Raymondbacteria bacterium RifOxyB12_full_50_8]OGK04144.1 MAG: hypothetical protein A2487_14105 [Candidatus Raymondbacteria bacterium RifOxyC12_full_50_8]
MPKYGINLTSFFIPDLKTILVGFYFFSSAIFSYWQESETRVFFYSSALLVLFYIPHFIKKIHPVIEINQYLKTYYIFFILCGISYIYLPSSDTDTHAIISLMKITVITFIVSNFIKSRNELLFVFFIISCSSLVLYNINQEQILVSRYLTSMNYRGGAARLAGTIGNANEMAMISIVSIWASLCLYCVFRSKLKYLILFNIVPSMVIIFMSGSRKGLLSVVFLFLMVYYFHIRHTIKKDIIHKVLITSFFVMLFSLTIVSIARSPFGDRLMNLVKLNYTSDSDVERIGFAKSAVLMFAESPFCGKGFNQFRHLSHIYGSKEGSYAHSTFFELLADNGFIGVCLYFGTFLMILIGIKRTLAIDQSKEDAVVLKFGIILIILVLFYNFFAVMYGHKLFWPLLAAYAGYISRLNKFS